MSDRIDEGPDECHLSVTSCPEQGSSTGGHAAVLYLYMDENRYNRLLRLRTRVKEKVSECS